MIKQSKPYIHESDFAYLTDVINSAYIARGQFVEKLEQVFAHTCCKQHAIATSSGTAALHLALLSLEVGKGDEVVIPSYVCSAVLNAVRYVGATPVLADIDLASCNITVETIKEYISERTKAIIITHTFGFPADVEHIYSLAQKHNVHLIEDCTHALGATDDGRPVGYRGHISIYSLYATKMITAGEGGMICTDDKRLAHTVRDLNSPDQRETYTVRYNYKMSDVAAGLALSQINQLDFFLERRRALAKDYYHAMRSLPITFQRALPHTRPSYYRFIILTSRAQDVITFSRDHEVECDRPVYKPLHIYTGIPDTKRFIATERIWNEGVSIPLYPALTDDERDTVIDVITTFFTMHNASQ